MSEWEGWEDGKRETEKLVHILHEGSPFEAKACSARLIRISSIAKHRYKPIDLSVYLHYGLIRLFRNAAHSLFIISSDSIIAR